MSQATSELLAQPVDSAYRVWELLSFALETATELHPLEGDPFGTSEPASSASHRGFRFEPGRASGEYRGRQRVDEDADDSDLLEKTLPIVITIYHDYDPNAHGESFRAASDDFETAEEALLAHPAAIATQCVLESHAAERRGHHIVHTMTLTAFYERPLPRIME